MASALRQEEPYLPILICSLCLKTLKRPRVLPCGHTYCCSCLQSHINDKLIKREAKDDIFPCPVCRAETSLSSSAANVDRWAYSFPINKMVVSLLDKTKEAGIEANCQVCYKRGRTTSASSYCNECDKYLCDTCREYHDDLRIICQNSVHRLYTGIDSKSVNPNISFVEMCPKHVEERIKVFCIDHSTLCCSMCGFLNHMKCDNINTLDDMIKEFNVQMKSEKIGTYLKDLENQLRHIKATVKRNAECIQREKDAILLELRTLMSSLNAKLQKIEDDLTCCLEQMCTIEDLNFELFGKKIDSLITAIKSDHTQIDLVKTYGSEPQKVIVLHNMEQNLNRYFSSISECQEDIKNVSFKFEVDKIFTSFLNACNGIGMVRVSRLKSKIPPCPSRDPLASKNAVKASEFNINMSEDKYVCHISDIIQLQDSRFIFVDHSNSKIKIYGVDFQCQDYVTFSKRPWNACVLTDIEVAVTVPKQRMIQIIRITPKIQKLREIRTRLECWGIAALREQIVITIGMDKHCIQTLDRVGREISERQIDSESVKLIQPRRLANNVLKKMMYVSDEKGEKLVAYNSSWDVEFIYKDQDIKTLSGLDTDKEGNIYLCGYGSKCVQQISGDGKLIKTIIAQKLENKPLAIRFYRDINRFLLTYGNCDAVEIYDLCK